MEIWSEDPARWWAQSTEAERLAVVRTIQRWARGVGDVWDFLDPRQSQEMYQVLGRSLGEWVREQGGAPVIDLEVRVAWGEFPDRAKAPWVELVGERLGLDQEGREAARVVSLALAPPPFRSLPAPEQVDLLRTVAGEIETYLEYDPRWYGRQTPAYEGMARAIRGLEQAAHPPGAEPCRLWWSHLGMGAREQVLGEIAGFARWAARGEEVQPPVRRELLELARSIEQIIAPARALPRGRE